MNDENNERLKVGQTVETSVSVCGERRPMATGKIVAVHSGYCDVDIMSLHGGNPWIIYPTNTSLRIME